MSACLFALGTGCATGFTATLHSLLREVCKEARGAVPFTSSLTASRSFSLSPALRRVGRHLSFCAPDIYATRADLAGHPLFALLQEVPQTRCSDPTCASLLDDVQTRVLCFPVLETAERLLDEPLRDPARLAEIFCQQQRRALTAYPERVRSLVLDVAEQHRQGVLRVLQPQFTHRHTRDEPDLAEVLQRLRFETLEAARCWSRLSSQLTSRLSGLAWRGSRICYSSNGSHDELLRALCWGATLLDTLEEEGCCVVVSQHNRILAAAASVQKTLASSPQNLIGQSDGVFWLEGTAPGVDWRGLTRLHPPWGESRVAHLTRSRFCVAESPTPCCVSLFLPSATTTADAEARFAFLASFATLGGLAALVQLSDFVVTDVVPEAGVAGLPRLSLGSSLAAQLGCGDDVLKRLQERFAQRGREDLTGAASEYDEAVRVLLDAFLVGRRPQRLIVQLRNAPARPFPLRNVEVSSYPSLH